MVFSINISNVGHIGNINPDIKRIGYLKTRDDIADLYQNRLMFETMLLMFDHTI